ncbi:MAG: FAD-binding domain-containing protein, partial [Cyanobacteria bacterium J06560_2]
MRPLQIVWLKKSFRLSDHRCLVQAASRGPVLPLYILEPDYWALPDTSYRQYLFLKGCLAEMATELEGVGAKLAVLQGDAVDVLQRLKETFVGAAYPSIDLWSHQETGNVWTYERDQRVRQWCSNNSTTFHEPLQFGVWRGSKIDRDHWAKHWDAFMAEPIVLLPKEITFATHDYDTTLPEPESLNLPHDGIQNLQPPGRTAALEALNSFLHERGEAYRTDMSSPITGESGCSRISPHLTYGTLSMREIYQTTQKRLDAVRDLPKAEKGTWAGSLSSFVGRLHWHCHFTQKLELEPELEWLPMARSYKGVRDDGDDAKRLRAFELGQTGYPFVDASLRYLRATGWINFRMRAMLMSFASYDLWLPWQKSGEVLARLFTDYEPGIHWPQSQMQSGVTGINTIRVYSPIKQGLDQDPEGTFTRQWVPEIAHLDDKVLQTPWLYEGEVALDYPPPIVEHKAAVRAAKDILWAIKKTPEAKAEAEKVYEKHGSRKKPRGRSQSAEKSGKASTKKASTKKASTKKTSAKKTSRKT